VIINFQRKKKKPSKNITKLNDKTNYAVYEKKTYDPST